MTQGRIELVVVTSSYLALGEGQAEPESETTACGGVGGLGEMHRKGPLAMDDLRRD
jgi:hypothetical protein